MPLRPLLLWLMLMLASPCGLAIDAVRGIHQLQHSSWTARDGAPDDISVMTQGHDGFLWLGTHAGLIRFDGLRFEPVIARQGSYPDTVVLGIKRARDGTLWFDSQHGLHRTRSAGTLAQGVLGISGDTESFLPKDGLSNSLVATLCEDNEGNLWVATYAGLDRFRQAAPVVLRTRGEPGQPEAFREQELLPGPDGAMWLARSELMPLALVGADGKLLRSFELPSLSTLMMSPQGLWVALPAGLAQIDSVSGRVLRTIAYPPEARPIGRTRRAVTAPDGSIWASFSGGDRNGQWRREPALSVGGQRNALALLVDGAGRVWLTYADGSVAVLDNGAVRTYPLQLGKAPALFEQAGQVWVAGEHGLALWRDGRFTMLCSADAHAFDGVVSLLRARDGSLWLNAAAGAVQVAASEVAQALRDPAYPMRTRIYDATDGVAGKVGMLHNLSVAEAGDGKIWFSRQSVTFWIDPHRPLASLPAPRAEISPLSVDGMQVDTGHERLPAGTRDLQLTYNASSLGTPSRLRFHYLLDGYDRHWHDAGSRRHAQYTGLGPGSYRFKVMAFNGDGVASPVAELPFRLLPAFYQTWWFRTLCALALLAALHAAFRWRVRRHDARLRARLEAQQAERERIARELHDTLLQGTQAVILHFHNASMALSANEPGRDGMLRALDAADRMLEEGRDHVQELRDGDDEDWPAILRREGERLAALHGVAFRYRESGTAPALLPAAGHEICRIASEALRNAFAHARAALIELDVRHARAMVQIDVRDDGLGLAAALAAGGQVAGHWGLPGMRERAAALGAELVLIKREGGGTHWRLCVPRNWQQRWTLCWRRWRGSGIEDAAL